MSDSHMPASFSAPAPAELAPLFPSYQIERLIATGGMGAVYRATQLSLDRQVALKILPRELTGDVVFRSSFESEAKAMARLNHPNLIGVYDFGEVAGMLYIIMEYVPGLSLFHYANGAALDAATVIHLVSGICNGLAHAHQNGIIHRDIKPSNILLDLNDEPKIGDFGLARPVDRKAADGEVIYGTPHYTAPEVINAPHSVDHRADIFSVGVMLHELLTGRLPADDPRPASAIVHCDPRFDSIIRRATDQVPDRRYTSAQEITHELQKIASSAGPRVLRTASHGPAVTRGHGHAVPNGIGHHPPHLRPQPTSTQSSSMPVVAVMLLVVGGILAWLVLNPGKEGPPPQVAAPQPPAPKAPVHTPAPHQPPPKPAIPSAPSPPVTKTTQSPENTAPSTTVPPPVTHLPEEETEANVEADHPTASHTPQHEQVPDTPKAPKPEFDVDDFLDNRARKIMRQRASYMIKDRGEKLAKNINLYNRALRRLLRDVSSRTYRNQYQKLIEAYISVCEKDNNLIPEKPAQSLLMLPGVQLVHIEYREKQETIEDELTSTLYSLAATYITGLQMQIDRLDNQDDAAAIEQLEEEINEVRSKPLYFRKLMLNEQDEEQENASRNAFGVNKTDEEDD